MKTILRWLFDEPTVIALFTVCDLVFFLAAVVDTRSIVAWCALLISTAATLAWIGFWIIWDVHTHSRGYK